MKRRISVIFAGLLGAILAQLAVHAAIAAAGAHPFPVLRFAWLHLAAFWAGGYVGGRIARRAWPALLPAAFLGAALIGEDRLVDPGLSGSTLVFVALGLLINVWTARRAARGPVRASSEQPSPRSP